MCRAQLIAPSQSERERVASSFFAGQPKVDVIMSKTVPSDTLYLLRLREDMDSRTTFHLKSLTQFREFDARLRAEADPQVLSEFVDLPANGRIGLRRQLSKVGWSHFLERQHEGVEQYLQTLIGQVSTVAVDKNLQGFFSGSRTPAGERLINAFLLEARGGRSISSFAGVWKCEGGQNVWMLSETGEATLNGQPNSAYNLSEHGEGVDRRIVRCDGWQMDLERSSTECIYWHHPGSEDEGWRRVEVPFKVVAARDVAPSCVPAWLGAREG